LPVSAAEEFARDPSRSPAAVAEETDDERSESPVRVANGPATAQTPTARRTITITGRGAERGWDGAWSSQAARRRPRDHFGRKPDRVAMWAVLLGVALAIGAATSSHAAVLSHAVLIVGH